MWVRGHLGKVRNAQDQGDDARARQAAEWMGYEVACFAALLNRRYSTRADLRWLKESETFPLLPDKYRDLLVRLHRARTGVEALQAAQDLYFACASLAARHGIRMESYGRLGELEV